MVIPFEWEILAQDRGDYTVRAAVVGVRLTRTIAGQRRTLRRTLDAHATLAERTAAKAEVLAEMDELEAETAPTDSGPQTTVASYSRRWLQGRAPTLRPSTRDRYVNHLSDYVLPAIGELAIEDVTRDVLQAMVSEWGRRRRKAGGRLVPYSAASIRSWWSVACTMLRDAYADYDLPDRTRKVRLDRLGAKSRREQRTLTADQVAALLRTVAEHAPHRYAEVYVLVMTGMRSGELYALRAQLGHVTDTMTRHYYSAHVEALAAAVDGWGQEIGRQE